MARKKKTEIMDIETNQIEIWTPEKFAIAIETHVHQGLTYLEAIMNFKEKYDADDLIIKKLMTTNILQSLRQEAVDLNLIRGKKNKKTRKLL